MTIVAPSILSIDFAYLGYQATEVVNYGAEWLHIDVMDGHFVPNITIGPVVVKSLRKTTNAVFDVHLMIENPEKYIKAFADSGADYITVHIEATKDIVSLLELIKSYDVKCGVSIKPNTGVDEIKDILHLLDLVLVMSVEPGFGGQSFMDSALPKIKELAQVKQEKRLHYHIEVDGGINLETGKLCVDAGADVLVAGSFIFKNEDKREAVKGLMKL